MSSLVENEFFSAIARAAQKPNGSNVNSFRTNRDLQSSLVLLAFALAYAMIAIRYPVDTLDNPGPGVFPRAVGVFLASVTAWQVLRTFWALRRGDAGSAGTPAEAEAGSSGSSAGGMELYGEVEPGVPCGRLVGGPFDGLPAVTKAGGFGKPDAFARALRFLRRR